MRTNIINSIVLDLGSSKIAGIAAYVQANGNLRVISQHLSHSDGLKSGIVTSLSRAESSMANAIYLLEKDCDKSINNVSISLSGASCKSHYIYHSINISNPRITNSDVQKLLHNALSGFQIDGREIIHYFPVEYVVDDGKTVQDPVGLFAKMLGIRLHIITSDSNVLLNLANSMSKCHVEISSIILAIYASGITCLTEDEHNLGSLVIDMGASTTSYGVFLGKKLLYSGYIPIGGDHITSDIAKVLSMNMRVAEKIKILYGSAVCLTSSRDNIINLEEFDQTTTFEHQMLTMNKLAQIIAPRVEEICELIKEDYDKLAIDHLIARKVVLTGGAAMLRGMKEVVSNIFEKRVRIGKPTSIDGFIEEYNPCAYSVAVGMLKIQSAAAQSNVISNETQGASFLKKMLIWFKDNI